MLLMSAPVPYGPDDDVLAWAAGGRGAPRPTVTTTSGRSLTTTTNRYVLPTNVEFEEATINGQNYQTAYDLTSRTKRFITPLGRVAQVTYDSFGRPTQIAAAGLAASAMS